MNFECQCGSFLKMFSMSEGTLLNFQYFTYRFKDVRVYAPITCIKLGIPIYFIDHSEFITVQCKKNERKSYSTVEVF